MDINKKMLQENFKELQHIYETICKNPTAPNVQALNTALQKFQKDIKDMHL